MNEELLGKVVRVHLIGVEKKVFRGNSLFLGSDAQKRSSYGYNLLYENAFDPLDSVHKMPVMPENPNFLKLERLVKDEVDLEQDFEEQVLPALSDSLKDMWGAYVVVDLSKTPVCRVYTENMSKVVDGKVVTVHKVGDFVHKKDPRTKEDTDELAILTQVPVWGFLRKTDDGRPIWLKDNDPLVRIQREINQGRLAYVNQVSDFSIKDAPDDAPDVEKTEGGESSPKSAKDLDDAPDLGTIA